MLRLSTPFARRSSAVLLGVALGGSAIVAAPAQAAEKPAPVEQGYRTQARGLGITLKAGPILLKKYGFKDEHLGLLSVNGEYGICYDYGEKSPDGRWTSGPVGDVKPGKARDRMQWTANAHWVEAQKSDKAAAAYKITINWFRSAEFRSDWAKSYAPQLKAQGKASWVAMADQWIEDAETFAGPAKVALDYSRPLPGGKGTAVVKVTQNGKPLSGAAVKWSIAGAAATSAGKTSRKDGTASATFVRGAGPVSIQVSAVVPEWREAGYTIPSRSSVQHLIRGGFSATVKASASFDSLLGVKAAANCEPFCDGTSTVTMESKASSSPTRVQAISGGKVLATLELAAGKAGKKSFTGRDGQSIGMRYSVRVNGKWSSWRTVKGITVVCPAWPKVTVTKVCACDGPGSASYTLTAPGGSRFYLVDVNGKRAKLSGKASTTISLTVPKGTDVSATFTAYADAGHTKKLASGVLDAWTQR